jgi:hypothetical protein
MSTEAFTHVDGVALNHRGQILMPARINGAPALLLATPSNR